MNRLKAITGGQPLRSDDWSFIQDATADALSALVVGLKRSTGTCIITGLGVTFGDGTVDVGEGVVFINDELFYVPATRFDYHDETWSVYLTPNITTGESRTFRDTLTHDVYEYRQYAAGYGASIPSGSIPFPGADILTLITSEVVSHVPAPPSQLLKYATVTYPVSSLTAPQSIIPAPGTGKAIKVISLSAWISPLSAIAAGTQWLNIAYYYDDGSASIGTFPHSFVVSAAAKMSDMVPAPADISVNQAVQVQLSSGAAPTSGSASIKFHCFYVIITL